MIIENFILQQSDVPCRLAELARELPNKHTDVGQLDKPFQLKQENRETLPPLSSETSERLGAQGYPETVLDKIGSEAEAGVYEDAQLEPAVINEKDALIRTDIDYDQKDFFDETNLERMRSGRSPLDENGVPIELHHIGQTQDAPLAELTRAEHRCNGNDNILHDKLKESEINREDFNKERKEYWQARAEQIDQQRTEGNT